MITPVDSAHQTAPDATQPEPAPVAERDLVAGVAREDFLHWWRGLGEGQALLQRVSLEPDATGEWTAEFMVYDAGGEYGWFGYAVERDGDGWRCEQYYEGDSTMKHGCDWAPAQEGGAQ